MKTHLKAAFLLICVTAMSANAASFSFYTNESDFLTAVTGKPSFNETYASIAPWGTRLDTNIFNFTNGSSFGYTANIPGTAPVFSFWGDTFGGVRALSTGDPETDVFVMTNFSLNTFAFGGYFFPSDGTGIVSDGTVTITTLFSDLSSTSTTSSRGSADLNNWFFGWVTDEPGTTVRSVTLTAGNDYASAADVTLAVPEPSTYALLGLAAVGLAGYIIRRRRA